MLGTRFVLIPLTAPGLLAACVQVPAGDPPPPAAAVPAAPAAQFQSSGDVAMSRSELVQIEAYLSQLGYQIGPIDGVIEPRTRAAIGAYEQADGRAPSGFYSPELLAALQRSVDGAAAAAAPAVSSEAPAPATAPARPRVGRGGGGDGSGGGGAGGGGGGGGW